jgi:hypothetical protein
MTIETKKKPLSVEDRILTLEYKDERREQHYVELKKDVDAMSGNITDIKSAIVGSDMNKDSGVLSEVKELKTTNKELLNKYELQRDKLIEYGVYFKILGFVSGVLVVAVISLIVK